jgi:hypothetical protein
VSALQAFIRTLRRLSLNNTRRWWNTFRWISRNSVLFPSLFFFSEVKN